MNKFDFRASFGAFFHWSTVGEYEIRIDINRIIGDHRCDISIPLL